MGTEDSCNNPRNILLVDDEPSVLLALKLLLEALGFTVHDFNSAPAALEYLRSDSGTDLVICDLKMPKMNGLQTLQEARQISKTLPFILMSGHANEDEVRLANQLGASGFLAKPFTPDQLKELLGILNRP